MIDIIKKYKKHTLIKNSGLIAVSLIMAIGINFYITDSNIGKKLQISVINSGEKNIVGDLYLEKSDNKINLIANKNMQRVKSIGLSIAYNPISLKINSIDQNIEGNIIKQENEQGLISIVLNTTNNKDINKGEIIMVINASKTQENIENINIINSNFTDGDNQVYLLSSTGVEY